uniref:Uncharacterized protein n=1 Tax=Plectus sambesii TaxID=2011161 RepID=A0A914VZ01_9BILA
RQTVQKQPQQQQQRQEIKKSIAPEAPKATAAPNVASTTEPKNRIHVTMKHRGRASKIVEVADTDDLPLPGYSAWSAWSHCDRPDGRRVRRRECELVKCTEKLLQVQWCRDINPDELTTTTKEPTSTTTVTPPPTTRPPSTTTSLWETAWSPWEGVCQKFSNGQVCNHGVLIGFETRRCNGNPFLCQGPFFRYCTMDC